MRSSPNTSRGLKPNSEHDPPQLVSELLKASEVRPALQKACAIVHGKGKGMSLLQLVALVLERGLPDEDARAKLLAVKLADTGNTTTD